MTKVDLRLGTPAEYQLAGEMTTAIDGFIRMAWPPGSCNPSLICSALCTVMAVIIADAPEGGRGQALEYMQDYLAQCVAAQVKANAGRGR